MYEEKYEIELKKYQSNFKKDSENLQIYKSSISSCQF